jgi:MoxR-like ATPase
MATAHLLHGYLGVGKTMLARRLEHEAQRTAPGQMARNARLVLPLLKAEPLSAVVRHDGRG